MLVLAWVALLSVACLSVVLTMKECRIDTVPSVLVLKVLGLVLLFWVPLWIVSHYGSL